MKTRRSRTPCSNRRQQCTWLLCGPGSASRLIKNGNKSHHRYLFSYPIAPLFEEFGWKPTPLGEAVVEYVTELQQEQAMAKL